MDNSDADKLRQDLQEIEALKRGEGLDKIVVPTLPSISPQNIQHQAQQSSALPNQVRAERPQGFVMNDRKILLIAALIVGFLAGFFFARSKSSRYQLQATGDSIYKIDTMTGQTWMVLVNKEIPVESDHSSVNKQKNRELYQSETNNGFTPEEIAELKARGLNPDDYEKVPNKK